MTTTEDTVRKAGRKRDPALDGVILEAALDVLAEVGVEGTTIDLVAARAGAARATVYRRWATKLDLVADAVRRLAPDAAAPLPDTGTLRDDLIASIQPDDDGRAERRIRVVAGLHAARDPRLAELLIAAGTGPWVDASRALIQRAIDRGEYPPVDVETLAAVIPMLCTARVAIERLPVTREYAVGLIDTVLLPALRGAAPTS